MIVHIVLLRLRPALQPHEILSFTRLMVATCRAIPSVQAAWVGPRVDVDAGYRRSFGDSTYDTVAVLEFADRSGLLDYLRHPLHAGLGRQFWQICDATVVFEAEVRDLKTAKLPESWSINPPTPRR